MHIKDHNDAMTFFRNSKQLESNGKWKEFVDEMEFEDMLQESRTMAQEPRNMYAGGQLVQNTVDGSRPGYNGEAKITKLAKEYQKITGSETILSNIKSKIRKKRLTEDLIDKYKKRGAFGGGFREKIEAVKNPKFYKTVLTELNKVKKQRNKNVFFDYDDVIKTGKWYKDLRTKLGNLNNVDTDTIVKKVLSEEFPGSYYGKTAMRDFRRDKVVKAFINYLDVNGELDGNEKRLPELQKFRGTGNKSYRNINETFQEWANGDFEVEGIDRKKLKADQIKQIKNWSPQYSSSLSVAKEKSMKFLNDLNTHNPNLSAKEVRQRFFKRFPDVTDGSFNARITHLTQLKNSGVYDIGGGATRTYEWATKGNRSPWLKELLGLKFQGNYSSFINRGDKLLNQGLTKEANRLYAAAEKYFGAKGIFTKVEGQGEHPFSRVFGSGPIGNELKINSLVRNDLNQFKRLNFDEPVIQDLTEYNKSTTTPKRRNELKFQIENRKKLMNYLTESPNEKGIVESVKFNYGPEKMTGSANVVDIDKVKNFNVEDYVRRGESYLEAFKAKGQKLGLVEDGAIIKQDWNKIIKSSKAKTMAKALQLAGISICSGQLVKKSSGGRIGFAEPVCGMEYAKQNEDAFMKKAAQSDEAAKLFKSGNIAKHLKNAKNWAKSNMGPTGWIGGELLIVGLGSVWDMSQGKGWKEAVDNWTGLGGHFGQAEARLKEIGLEQGYNEEEINDAMKIGQLMDLSTKAEEKQWQLDQVQEQQDIGGTARYKVDPGKRWTDRPRGYIEGQYQDPKRIRDLKTETPKLWEKGNEIYESLKDYGSSTELYNEMQQKKAKEEYDKKMRLREMPHHFAQQFKVSGEPEFEAWTPEYAEGGLAGLMKKYYD